MDRPGSPPNDPSLLLLNEIEILLAQTRLMELYLKQAQVSAAHKAIGVREQHQAELAELRRALAEKEQVVAIQQSAASANEKTLLECIDNLQVRVSEQGNLLAGKENQLRQSETEIAALRQSIAELEAARKQSDAAALSSAQVHRDLESMLAALRLELEGSRRDGQRQEQLAQELHKSAREQLERLQNQLTERHLWAAATGTELQRATDEIDHLNRRIAELEGDRQELTAATAREAEQARRGFASQLLSLQTALSARDHDLQHSHRAFGEIERALNAEVQTLRKQFNDKYEALELRDHQLRDALAEITTLQGRIGPLEAVHQQATTVAAESEQARAALESEIASLRHEVASRERALTERQQAVSAVELALHGKIQALQQELARSRSAVAARESELDELRRESNSLHATVNALEFAAHTETEARRVLENTCATLETKVASVAALVAEKEATLRAAEKGLHAHQEHFAGAITDLHRQLEDQTRMVREGAIELDQLRSESARLRELNERSEAERREVERHAVEADAVRRELAARLQAKDDELRAALISAEEQKTAALAEQDRNFRLASERQHGETDRLREELNQQEIANRQSEAELESVRSQNAWLREQNQQSDHCRSELEKNWQDAAALSRELETRLQAKEDEIRAHVTTIGQRDLALTEQAARFKSIEEQRGGEIAQLRSLIDTHKSSLEQNHAELVRLQAEIANLNDQNSHLDERRRELEAQLHDREQALHETRANANEKQEQATRLTAASEQLGAERNQSRDQLEQQTRNVEQANHELSELRGEMARLREQNDRSQTGRVELEQSWRQAETRQQQLAEQLEAKEDELRQARVTAHEQQEAALRAQAACFAASEGELRGELRELRSQLEERQKSAEQNEQTSIQLNVEITELREQSRRVEQARAELEQNWQQAAALTRELETRLQSKDDEFHAQIGALEQRDAALTEQAARFKSLEEQTAGAIAQLIDGHRSSLEQNHAELVRLQAEIANLNDQNSHLDERRRELEAQLHDREHALHETQANANDKQEQAARLTAASEQLSAELNQSRDRLEQQTRNVEQANHELTELRGEIARLREQNDQSESGRRQLEQNWRQAESRQQQLTEQLETKENELRRSQSSAREQQEAALRAQAASSAAGEGELRGELALLRSKLEDSQKSAEQNAQASIQLNTEIAELRAQNRQAEQARAELEQNWQQAITLRQEIEARLHAKENELQAQRATAAEQHSAALAEQVANTNLRERQLGEEISHLRNQLDQQQRQSANAHSELSALHAEVSALRERSAGAETARADLERHAALIEVLRSELAASVQAKQDELEATHATATAQLAAALREQEQRFAAVEDRLQTETAQLRAELEEQARIAASGGREVVQVRSELASVQKQNLLSEQARRELEQNWQQIVALRQELEGHLRAKDDELRATRSSAAELKSELDAKLNQLESDLAEKQVLVNRRDVELDLFKTETSRLSAELAARESALDDIQSKLGKELELNRATHQSELVAFREESAFRQQTLEQQLLQRQEETSGLRQQLQELERRTERSELESSTREQNLAAAVAECAALRARLLELESQRHGEDAAAREEFDQARLSLEGELKQLRNEVQQKSWALAQQQASMENLALAHKQRLQKLEDRLVEQHNANDRSEELGKAQLETRSLRQRIEELQRALQEAQSAAEQRSEQIDQNYAAQVETLSTDVSRQSAALQERESAFARREQLLRGEIEALIREGQEKNQILLNRNDELVQAKADRDMLRERLTELESATNQNEAAVLEDAEQMRTEFQAQLALLQAELSQKEWALEEQRALASGPDQQYRGQFEASNQKFDSAEPHVRQKPAPFIGAEKVNGERQQPYRKDRQAIDAPTEDPNHASRPRESRRWRTRFASKRRWIT